MNEDDVAALDLERMFLGDLSILFILEIVIRTTVMFGYTVGLVRLLGKRGMRQLTPLELAIIIAMGSAVGDPMFYAEVPLLHGMVVVTVIVALELLLGKATSSSERFERLIESGPRLVVRDGRVDIRALRSEGLGPDELFASLREKGFSNLGDVRLAYLESSGNVSAFESGEGPPEVGLSLLPEDLAGEGPGDGDGRLVCRHCGALLEAGRRDVEECSACHVKFPFVQARPREATARPQH